jgi:hypothetical protein
VGACWHVLWQLLSLTWQGLHGVLTLCLLSSHIPLGQACVAGCVLPLLLHYEW